MEFLWAASGMSEFSSTLPWENEAGRSTPDAGLPNLQKKTENSVLSNDPAKVIVS